MNILVNLIPIKKGGGQQVASNFVRQVATLDDHNFVFLTTKGSEIHNLLEALCLKYVEIENNIISRIWFTFISIKSYCRSNRVDVIYTMFGPPLFAPNVISISGCAYSNIFFPEIDFWKETNFFKKVRRKVIDHYRLKSTLKSDAIIFENLSMQERCINLFNVKRSRTTWIPPSISTYSTTDRLELPTYIKDFKVLMMTGWHKNKNIDIVPQVLNELKNIGVLDVSFVITVNPLDPESVSLLKHAKSLGVDKNIFLISQIKPSLIPDLISQVDSIALFSLLESFSNNIIEAWFFEKPLLISDEEWSRSICDQAAIYVDRDNPKSIAENIFKIKSNNDFLKNVVSEGIKALKRYPTPEEKVTMQIDFIKKIFHESSN